MLILLNLIKLNKAMKSGPNFCARCLSIWSVKSAPVVCQSVFFGTRSLLKCANTYMHKYLIFNTYAILSSSLYKWLTRVMNTSATRMKLC